MPDLSQSLQGKDLAHLKVVANFWDISLHAPDARAALQQLAPLMLDSERTAEVISDLTEPAKTALAVLVENGGHLPWSLFTRRYGSVREMGPARRDRDRPYAKPVSPAEILWYRALIARAFFDTPNGPEEFAYIPDDLLELIPASQGSGPAPLGRLAIPAERQHTFPAGDFLLDHACTLLAALRLDLPPDELTSLAENWFQSACPLSTTVLKALLSSASLIQESGSLQPDATRVFLEASRGEALAQLFDAWRCSETFDDLRQIVHLKPEGAWQNNPLRTRTTLLNFLAAVPEGAWWSIQAFIDAVRQAHPDFQRPAGDYDSWFIRDGRSGEFLRGFEHWNEVEGELIRFIITGPLHWFGVVDLAAPAPDAPAAAFRTSAWAPALLSGTIPGGLSKEDENFQASSDARLRVPRLAPRAARYLLARFCAWEGEADGYYRYRLTPQSLARARLQGLTTAHLLNLLRRHTPGIPPSLQKALERWEQQGTEAFFEEVVVLRLSSPDILQKLRASRASRFLGDPLGPTTIIVKSDAVEKVLRALAEMGYLGEVRN